MKIQPQGAVPSLSSARSAEKAMTVEEQRLREKCREFETILLQKMVETLQGDNSLFGDGVQGDFFRGMFAEEIAKELAKEPGLGLAESIYRTLVDQNDER
jgi:Rod binding domain-containing protein